MKVRPVQLTFQRYQDENQDEDEAHDWQRDEESYNGRDDTSSKDDGGAKILETEELHRHSDRLQKAVTHFLSDDDEGTFDVKVVYDPRIDGFGFDVGHHPLSIAHLQVDAANAYEPMAENDMIVKVDGVEVLTYEEYMSAIHDLDEFVLTLRHVGKVFDVTVHRDVDAEYQPPGDHGFTLAYPPLQIGRVDRQAELAPMKLGNLVLAVNGTYLETEEEFEKETNDLKVYTLTLLDSLSLASSVTRTSPIRVTIVRATGLRKADMLGSNSDAYCTCEVQGKPKNRFKTAVVSDSQEPEWGHYHDILDFSAEDTLVFKVWDKDLLQDDFLGTASLVHLTKFEEAPIPLDDAGKEILAHLTVKIEQLANILKPIRLTIVGAKGLRHADYVKGSDPYCICTIKGNVEHKCKTPVVDDTGEPQWNFTHDFLYFCRSDVLEFEVWDADVGRDDMLGQVSLENAHGVLGQRLQLPLQNAGKGANAVLEVQVDEIEALPLQLTVVRAEGLREADIGSGSDPYCCCEIIDRTSAKFRTKVVNNSVAPVWNHQHTFVEFLPGDTLKFTIWDKDLLSDDKLGVCEWQPQKKDVEGGCKEKLEIVDEKAPSDASPAYLFVEISKLRNDQEKLKQMRKELGDVRSKLREQQDVVDKKHQALKNALKKNQNMGGMDAKAKEEVAAVNDKDGEKMRDYLKKSERCWSDKDGSILDELFTNCRGYDSVHGSHKLTIDDLAEVCLEVMETHGKSIQLEKKFHCSLALTCMVLYTQTDVDIDRLFGFADAPVLPPGMEAPADRDKFYKNYRDNIAAGKRNAQMFQDANWATRVAWEGRPDKAVELQAWSGYSTWIKWICLLAIICQRFPKGRTVTRGLTGLPDSIINNFKSMVPGMTVFWAALSSTTEDNTISWNYCSQQEPVERNAVFTIYNVNEGIEVSRISQYPNERELLLPPWTLFEVRKTSFAEGKPIEIECEFLGSQMHESFRKMCEEDFLNAKWIMAEAEARAKEREAQRRLEQSELETLERRLEDLEGREDVDQEELDQLRKLIEEKTSHLEMLMATHGADDAEEEKQVAQKRKQGPFKAKVEIIGARCLRRLGNSVLPSFWCSFQVDGKPGSEFRTDVKDNTLSPVWNVAGTVQDCYLKDELVFRLWDVDWTGEDLVGQGRIDFASVYPMGFHGPLELFAGYRSSRKALLSIKITVLNPDAVDANKALVPRKGSVLLVL